MINKENSLASFIGIQSEVVCVWRTWWSGAPLSESPDRGGEDSQEFCGLQYFVNLMTSLLSKVVKRFSILFCCLNLFDFFFS